MKKRVTYRGKEYLIEVLENGKLVIDGEVYSSAVSSGLENIYKVVVDRQTFTVEIRDGEMFVDGEEANITVKPHIPVEVTLGRMEHKTSWAVKAPIPGKIVQLLVKENDAVTKDQELVILEAMKMRNRIFSPADGVVTRVHIEIDSSVNQDQTLIEIKAEEIKEHSQKI